MATTITLTEYEPTLLPAAALPPGAGRKLWRDYDQGRGVVHVAFPSPRTGGNWQLTAQGWVGQIALTPALHLSLQPRAPFSNLFRLLAAVDALPELPAGALVGCRSLGELYEQLALLLAQGALQQVRRGASRAYVVRNGALPYVRGRLDLRAAQERPWWPRPTCRYEEQTTDVPDNQLLAWTLQQVALSGLCAPAVQRQVRRAYQQMRRLATPAPVAAATAYSRLNQGYAPLHALCRFFLRHRGPSHESGDEAMVPFLVYMPRLFEQFVAVRLRQAMPAPWRLQAQQSVPVGADDAVRFAVDLVLYDGTGRAQAVLDTKYRPATRVAASEVQQVVAYAQAVGCRTAALIYPAPLAQPWAATVGDVYVRALPLPLDGDLDAAGRALWQELALRLAPLAASA